MVLKFDLNNIKYDSSQKLVRFFAMDGGERIRCSVTLNALALAEGKSVPDKKSPALFRKHAEKIYQIVTRKYQSRKFDKWGKIVILASDIDVYGPWSANLPNVKSIQPSPT